MAEIVVQTSPMSPEQAAIREVLDGRRHGIRAILAIAGPAIVVSIAYMDPGNFATNIQAGAQFGYGLLWVVLTANLIAMLFQALSAKLGIVTGRNLAELCRERLPRPLVYVMWIASEIAAMATDLAEFLGGAIGLSLLFNLPLIWGMIATAIVTYGILMFERRGFRPVELIIGGLVSIICLCYLIELFLVPVDWAAAAYHTVVPQLEGAAAVTISVGIIGATVMPHAIYLHSGLTQARLPVHTDADRRKLLRYSNREVIVALAAAGAVNMAMVMMASGAFHEGHADVGQIETAYHTLGPLLGAGAATAFLISLLASGISSSAVGTMAGQMIMQGFVGFQIPVVVRRLVTMVPAFVVVGLGTDATTALIISQVILSLTLPIPMIALLLFTQRADVMGSFVNGRLTRLTAMLATAVVLFLNTIVLLQAFGVPFPFMEK
jgi:manganese transport protein